MTPVERKSRILVLGATGQVGSAVIAQLRNTAAVEVIAAARNIAKAQALGVPAVYLDLDKIETFAPALATIDRLFLVTGYTVDMLRQSKDLVCCAKRAGVQLIVHLGACGDDDTRVAHYGWHQFIERYIESSHLAFVHLRPEIFMQNLLGYGGERYVTQGVIRHYVGAARLSWVDCDDVAAVAAQCLSDPAPHLGNTYRLGYEALTYADIATLMTRAFGQPFRYEPRPPLEFLRNALAAGAEPAYMKCVFDSYTDFSNGLDEGADETFDNFMGLVGRKPRTFTEFLLRNKQHFRY
jgi:NAD(P)H dehydrogenase (quinone)